MIKKPVPMNRRQDSVTVALAGLRYSLFRSAGKLTRLEFVDESRGLTWASGRLDFELAVTVAGKSLKATDVVVSDARQKADRDGTTWRVTLSPCFKAGAAPACALELELRLPNHGRWLEERFTLRNTGERPLEVTAMRAMLSVDVSGRNIQYFAVPFQECRARPWLVDLKAQPTFECRRDGAVLVENAQGLTISRRPVDFYAEPQLVGVKRSGNRLSFAGVGNGVPSGMSHLALGAGEAKDFGVTRYTPFTGELEDGLLAYREFMAGCGVRLPAKYSPPLNYCIYYECRDRYHHHQLLQALARAAEIGCTLLYTDQGWEDYFGSGRWDETRLGKIEDFIAAAKRAKMKVGVLIGMHADAYVWPKEYWRTGDDGKALFGDKWGAGHSIGICPTVKAWQKEKTRRLAKIVKAGVSFFSFDFNDNTEPCRDGKHAHQVPLRGWEHCVGVARQQQQIKKACPSVLIEAHDWEFAGSATWPVYLFADGHDELWGFEFMWDPFGDLTSGRLHNLYYYNLAYELPLYLHIDLAKDSPNRVVFWYAASTVRHLGIGNYAVLDEKQKASVRQAVVIYKEHQRFFTIGRFSGPDPLTHIHALPGDGALVLRFNDQARPLSGTLELTKEQLGCLGGIGEVSVLVGGKIGRAKSADRLRVDFTLEAHDVLVLRVCPR
ncbi:MAG: hypothetical protein NT031_11510 [Planctomycetota bacterium]|nr:hypothetical protein [Planctomycetota bacterium]